MERNYTNLKTFTYGISGNHEMLKAEEITRSLNIDWTPIESRVKGLASLYKHPDRIGYAQYADGLHTLPVYLDYEAIHDLVKLRRKNVDAIVVNGYSGDFLFGGHIPEELLP